MCHAYNEEWKKRNNRISKTVGSGKLRSLPRKNWRIFWNIGSRHHQTSKDERDNYQRIPQKNEKTSRNKAFETYKQQDIPLCKVL